jgi:hypothetical protein
MAKSEGGDTWGLPESPPDSPAHGSDLLGTVSEAAPPPEVEPPAPAPEPEQAPAPLSEEMQVANEQLNALLTTALSNVSHPPLRFRRASLGPKSDVTLRAASPLHVCADGAAGGWCVARRAQPRGAEGKARGNEKRGAKHQGAHAPPRSYQTSSKTSRSNWLTSKRR